MSEPSEPAAFYTGIVVDAYARLKSSSFDPEPYADFVRKTGEPALEIGCGDGDPLLALRATGLDVEGVDSSADMLAACAARAATAGLDVVLHEQRMEALALPRHYRSIYLAGPTFNLLPDDDTAMRALVGVRAHLEPEGRVLVPLWIPPPTPEDELGVVRSADDGRGAVLRYVAVSETYDVATRTRTTTTRYERETAAGVEVAHREWVIHWHTADGFRLLCERAALTVVELEPDGDDGLVALLAP